MGGGSSLSLGVPGGEDQLSPEFTTLREHVPGLGGCGSGWSPPLV